MKVTMMMIIIIHLKIDKAPEVISGTEGMGWEKTQHVGPPETPTMFLVQGPRFPICECFNKTVPFKSLGERKSFGHSSGKETSSPRLSF